MKKCKVLIIFGLLILVNCIFSLTVYGASARITASSSSITVNQEITITTTVTDSAAWNLKLTGAITKNYAGDSGDGKNTTKTFTDKFKPTSAGTYTVSLSGDVTGERGTSDENGKDISGESVTITVTEPQKPTENPGGNTGNQGGNTGNQGGNSGNSGNTTSNPGTTTTPQASNNANLKMLGVTKYDFSGFKKNVYEYKVKDAIPNDVTSVSVYATTDDSNATYTVSGDKNLKVGTNKITVTVTAADKKTKKDYVIYIERKATTDEEVTPNVVDEEKPEEKKEHKGLQSIILDESLGFDLNPEFKSNVFSYKLKITGDLKSIPLKANPIDEDAKVTITGNEDLVDGENLITIEVTFEDDPNTSFTYKITVLKNVEEKNDDKETEGATGTTKDVTSDKKSDGLFSSSLSVAIAIFVVVFIVSGVITFLLIKERKPKSPWGDEDEEELDAPGALEDEKDFKPRAKVSKSKLETKKDIKEFEELETSKGKGRH